MYINLVEQKKKLTFADLEIGDIFLPILDGGEDDSIYMVTDSVSYNDYNNDPVELNAIDLIHGGLMFFTEGVPVQKCEVIIDTEE